LARVHRGRLQATHVLQLGHERPPVLLEPAAGQHGVSALEAQADPIRLPKDPGGQRPGSIAQLDREVSAAVASRQAVLAYAGKTALEALARPQLGDPRVTSFARRDRNRGFHALMVNPRSDDPGR